MTSPLSVTAVRCRCTPFPVFRALPQSSRGAGPRRAASAAKKVVAQKIAFPLVAARWKSVSRVLRCSSAIDVQEVAAGPEAAVTLSIKYRVSFGDTIVMVGGSEQLGDWDPRQGLSLTWGDEDVWSVTQPLPPGSYEFKSVIIKGDGSYLWEEGGNRKIKVPTGAKALSFSCSWGTLEEIDPVEGSVVLDQIAEAPGSDNEASSAADTSESKDQSGGEELNGVASELGNGLSNGTVNGVARAESNGVSNSLYEDTNGVLKTADDLPVEAETGAEASFVASVLELPDAAQNGTPALNGTPPSDAAAGGAVTQVVEPSFDIPAPVQVAVTVVGLSALGVVGWSLYTLQSTGCGLPPGPNGAVGAAEGLSYLSVGALLGWSASRRARGGGGLPGPLASVEALSVASMLAGLGVLAYQVKTYGYVPSVLPDENCYGSGSANAGVSLPALPDLGAAAAAAVATTKAFMDSHSSEVSVLTSAIGSQLTGSGGVVESTLRTGAEQMGATWSQGASQVAAAWQSNAALLPEVAAKAAASGGQLASKLQAAGADLAVQLQAGSADVASQLQVSGGKLGAKLQAGGADLTGQLKAAGEQLAVGAGQLASKVQASGADLASQLNATSGDVLSRLQAGGSDLAGSLAVTGGGLLSKAKAGSGELAGAIAVTSSELLSKVQAGGGELASSLAATSGQLLSRVQAGSVEMAGTLAVTGGDVLSKVQAGGGELLQKAQAGGSEALAKVQVGGNDLASMLAVSGADVLSKVQASSAEVASTLAVTGGDILSKVQGSSSEVLSKVQAGSSNAVASLVVVGGDLAHELQAGSSQVLSKVASGSGDAAARLAASLPGNGVDLLANVSASGAELAAKMQAGGGELVSKVGEGSGGLAARFWASGFAFLSSVSASGGELAASLQQDGQLAARWQAVSNDVASGVQQVGSAELAAGVEQGVSGVAAGLASVLAAATHAGIDQQVLASVNSLFHQMW